MINPMKLMQIKGMWDQFTSNHPKFPMFLSAVNSRGIKDGTIVDITVIDPDGEKMQTNIKISASDMQLFEQLKNFSADN